MLVWKSGGSREEEGPLFFVWKFVGGGRGAEAKPTNGASGEHSLRNDAGPHKASSGGKPSKNQSDVVGIEKN